MLSTLTVDTLPTDDSQRISTLKSLEDNLHKATKTVHSMLQQIMQDKAKSQKDEIASQKEILQKEDDQLKKLAEEEKVEEEAAQAAEQELAIA